MTQGTVISCLCFTVKCTLLCVMFTGTVLSYSCITVTQINYYIGHYHFMYIYHRYTYIVTLDTIIHTHVPLIHGYTIPLDTFILYICITATRILCTHHILIALLHKFTCIHALIVSIFLLHGSPFLLHEYFCIPVK